MYVRPSRVIGAVDTIKTDSEEVLDGTQQTHVYVTGLYKAGTFDLPIHAT